MLIARRHVNGLLPRGLRPRHPRGLLHHSNGRPHPEGAHCDDRRDSELGAPPVDRERGALQDRVPALAKNMIRGWEWGGVLLVLERYCCCRFVAENDASRTTGPPHNTPGSASKQPEGKRLARNSAMIYHAQQVRNSQIGAFRTALFVGSLFDV